jgi:hypothetical protein
MKTHYSSFKATLLAVSTLSLALHSKSRATTVQWMDMSPNPADSATRVPSGSVFSLPGLGNVTMTYSMPAILTSGRGINAPYSNGSASSVSWGTWEYLATYRAAHSPLDDVWTITYTFDNPVPANTLYVGAFGLGSTTNEGGRISSVTGDHNATFLGDYRPAGSTAGATFFSGGAGSFFMKNSQINAGGANPWWNSDLGVAQITDGGFTSLSLTINQVSGDGFGFNIGSAIPEPSAALLGVISAGMLLARRRR